MPRQRDPVHIRQDAIKMAIRRAQAGCPSCAQKYFELAQQHGATEEEINSAVNNATESQETRMSRRDILKLAAATAVGAALATDAFLSQNAEAYSSYWGTDSNSQSCCGIPQNFYIGRFGYGTTSSTYYFNVNAAKAAGLYGTYEYWGVVGPTAGPGNITAYQWGYNQGSTAASQWVNNPNAGYVGGSTVFGDVEPGFGGWGSNQFNNQQVLQGFLDAIVLSNNYGLTPGVYISPGNWRSFFGTSFITSQRFVFWLAGCYTCYISCSPCNTNCNTTLTEVQSLLSTTANIILGRSQMVLWQYWISNCSCGDFNVAIQNPVNGFTPIASSTTYRSSC